MKNMLVSSNRIGKTSIDLNKANDLIGQFISSCSHSMRGPLKSMQGLVNLLRNKNFDETERGVFLELMYKTTQKMENMLDELEHLLENAKKDVVTNDFNIQTLIYEIVGLYQEQIQKSGIEVSIQVEQYHNICVDRHRLRLVLVNVIENAVNFQDVTKEKSELRICVKTSGTDIFISVFDNGIGIETASKNKIFQLFYRGSEKSSGAGIGLYVVNEVIQKMGGTILVESIPGEGATFFLKIPSEIAQLRVG